MKKWLVISLMILFIASINFAEKKFSLNNLPAVVIKTVPTAGDTAVSPDLSEIKVVFSKEMFTHNSWSFAHFAKEISPEFTGQIQYLDDKKTCVAKVKLKPGKTYAIWLNYGNHQGFRDKNLKPAIPYLLVFRTADQ